jgi:hypothetical protein
LLTYGPYVGLPAAQNIALLDEGVMSQKDGIVATHLPLPVTLGGIGISSITKNDLLLGDASNGIVQLPTGQPLQVLQISVDGNTVLWGDVAAPVGVVQVAHGGTGVTSSLLGTMLYGTGTTIMQRLLIGTFNQILRVGAANVPEWTAYTSGVLQSNGSQVTSSTVDLTNSNQVAVPAAGIIQSNGSAISSGYVNASFISGILPVANGGSGNNVIASGIVSSNGTVLSGASLVNLASQVTSVLPTTNGGSGAASIAAGLVSSSGSVLTGGALVDLAIQVSGVLAVANGGTGTTTSTGSGSVVLDNTPTIQSAQLVTPALGTPSSGVITNCTGGPTLTNATFVTPALGTPASGVITNCTGGPTLTSATFITPALGTPASGVITNCTGGPTLTSATFITPALGTPASGVLTNCTGGPTLTNATLVTPALGTPASGVLTNCTGGPTLTNATLVTPALGTPSSGALTTCTGYTYANLSGTPIFAKITVPVVQTITMNTAIVTLSGTDINNLTAAAGIQVVAAPGANIFVHVIGWDCYRGAVTAHATGTAALGLYWGSTVAAGSQIASSIVSSSALKGAVAVFSSAATGTNASITASTVLNAAVNVFLVSGSQYTSGAGATELTVIVHYLPVYVAPS